MGIIFTVINQNFPPKPKWTAENIPDMSGKTVLITGGNTGIGRECVKSILLHNAKVYILARDQDRTLKAISEIKAETGKDALEFIKCDLGDLSSIRTAAEEFMRKEKKLDVLLNNAGVMIPPVEWTTKDGYDYQFGVNALGHYFLTSLLDPILKSTASQPGTSPVRIVTVTSAGHIFSEGIDYTTIIDKGDNTKRRKMSSFDLYNQSKFANVVFASELARKYAGANITSTAVHPGMINSDLGRNAPKLFMSIAKHINYDVTKGAITSLYAATAPETENANGKYFIAFARETKPNLKCLEPKVGEELMAWFEEQVKNH